MSDNTLVIEFPMQNRLFPVVMLSALLAAGQAAGQESDRAAQSGEQTQCPQPNQALQWPAPPQRQGESLLVEARLGRYAADRITLQGDVELRRGDQLFLTEELIYQQLEGLITIPGALEYADQTLGFRAARAEYNLRLESGSASQVSYQLPSGLGNGEAGGIQIMRPGKTRLEQVSYTTCSGPDPDWQLRSASIQLDQEKGRGSATGAKLEFKGIPLLYLPWVTFPLDDRRQTGFLYPQIATANDNGIDMEIPWYWNIAPNQDATLTPRIISDRGLMLKSNYRWLTRRSRGEVSLEYLPRDDNTRDRRLRYLLTHRARISPAWNTRLRLERVSDDDYFSDFGQGLAETSRQFLHSEVFLTGIGRNWRLEITADNYQVIDTAVAPSREPYRRLPRLDYVLDMPIRNSLFDFQLEGELVAFDRDVGVTGSRLDLYPRVVWNWERPAGYVRPSAGYRYTGYSLDRLDTFSDETPSRSLPIVSVDAGLFFDRVLPSGAIQTLEPRLFYLYVPLESQNDLPDFDTAPLTFGFSQLFHSNRFAGADRQGDANQLTLALTSRHMDPKTGAEKYNLNLGQIFFFDDLDVHLNASQPVMVDTSSLIAEANYYPNSQIATRFGLQWSWEENELDVGYAGIEFHNRKHLRLSFDYRFRRDRVEQVDVRLSLPLRKGWHGLARWNYDLDGSDNLEALAGLEYRSCCWAFRVFGRKYLKNRDGESRNGLFLELELTGLGSVGRRPYPLFRKESYLP